MKKALLVGINKYKDSPLRGCVNDCILMYKVLYEKFSFNKKDINLITDHECTKKNILRQLRLLISDIKDGDIIYFHYSGHGSQVVVNDWTNTSEADGLDEIICPIDLNWNDPLRDNDLNKIFKSLPTGVKIIVTLDCCHSGTGLRNTPRSITRFQSIDDYLNRFYPPPPSNILSNPKISIDEDLGFIMPKFDSKDIQTKKNSFLNATTNQGDAILISGCQENQVSADAWIANTYYGALTYTLVEILSWHKYKMKLKNMVREINKRLQQRGFVQQPQLECKKEFFDLNFLF